MRVLLMVMVALSSFLLCMALLQLVFLSNRRMQKRMKHYLAMNDERKLRGKSFNLLVQLQLSKQAVRDKVLTKKKNERLETVLARAGVPLKPEEYVIAQWIAAALAGGFLYLASGTPLMLLVGLPVGFLLPRWWVGRKLKLRVNQFQDGLLDMLTTIIGSLRAGFSFAQALKTVVDETDGPVREEADTVLRELQYGASMEEALGEWKERMPSEDLDLMVQAILIQRQIGGNLAVVLETIVTTIRDRGRIQRQIRTLTAQGRLSGIVIGLLPLVLGFVLYLIQPGYIGTLFQSAIGLGLVGVGLVSGTIGFVLIRKMTTIEV